MQSTEVGKNPARKIFHVSSRETIQGLRDEILRMHGFEVKSTLFSRQTLGELGHKEYDLVLIDVESENRVESAQELCDDIKKIVPNSMLPSSATTASRLKATAPTKSSAQSST